jgi:hypothetical protein
MTKLHEALLSGKADSRLSGVIQAAIGFLNSTKITGEHAGDGYRDASKGISMLHRLQKRSDLYKVGWLVVPN